MKIGKVSEKGSDNEKRITDRSGPFTFSFLFCLELAPLQKTNK